MRCGHAIYYSVVPGTFYKKLKNFSCEYNRLNGWNSTLQAAWYIRRVRIIWFLWTKHTIWSLILSFTQNIVRACSMFYPYEGYRSVTPLDAARVNRTIFDNHSVHWYYITLIKGRYSIKHDINVRRGKQNPLVYIYCYYLRTGLFCRDMTVSAIRCVVSTKYSVFSSCFVLCTRNSVSSSLRACRPSWSPPCQCVRPGIALAVGMLTQEQWLVPSMLYETVLYRDAFVCRVMLITTLVSQFLICNTGVVIKFLSTTPRLVCATRPGSPRNFHGCFGMVKGYRWSYPVAENGPVPDEIRRILVHRQNI